MPVTGEGEAPIPLMEQAVVMPAEEEGVPEVRCPAVGPMLDVVRLTEARGTAGEAAAAVAEVERSSKRGRNRAGAAPEVQDFPAGSPGDLDPARIAGEAPGRFRGNADAGFDVGTGEVWALKGLRSHACGPRSVARARSLQSLQSI